jgi:hypothetical protein
MVRLCGEIQKMNDAPSRKFPRRFETIVAEIEPE